MRQQRKGVLAAAILTAISWAGAQTYIPPLEGMTLSGANPYAAFNSNPDNPNRYHSGTDVKSSLRDPGAYDTPVFPTADGTVRGVFRTSDTTTACDGTPFTSPSTVNRGLGNCVVVEHAGGRYSLYGHLDCIDQGISNGLQVSQGPNGTRLGILGHSADANRRHPGFGPHLHFEIKDRPTLGDDSNSPGDGWVGYMPDVPDGFGYADPQTVLMPFETETVLPTALAVNETTNVRSGPDTTYEVLTTVPAGQRAVGVGRSSGWWKIALPNADGPAMGWITNTTSTELPWSTTTATADGLGSGGLFVRTAAGATADSTRINTRNGQLQLRVWEGQRFVVREQQLVGAVPWFRIDLPTVAAQSTGWISGQFAKHTGDLQVEAAVDPNPVAPGELVGVTIALANVGSRTAHLEGYLSVPAHTTVVDDDSGSCPGGTCDPGEEIHWFVSYLEGGETVSLRVLLRVDADAPAGDALAARLRFGDGDGFDVVRDVPLRIRATPSLRLGGGFAPAPVRAGIPAVLGLVAGNAAATPSGVLTLTASVPAGLSVADADGGVESGGSVTWTLGVLAPGTITERHLRLTVPGTAADGALLASTLALSEAGGAASPVTTRAFAYVGAASALEGIGEVESDPAPAGGLVTFLFHWTNPSQNSVGATVRFVVPPHTTIVEYTDGSCPNPCSTGREIRWQRTVYPRQTHTVRVLLRVDADAPPGALVDGRWRVDDDDHAGIFLARNVAVATPGPLDVVAGARPDTAKPGETVSWALTVSNPTGAAVATSTLMATVPRGTVLGDLGGGTAATTSRGQVVTWSLPVMAAGEVLQRVFQTLVPGVTPVATLLATDVRVASGDDGMPDDRTSATAGVRSVPRPQLEVEPSSALVVPGGLVSYVVRHTNPSEEQVGFQVHTTLPPYTRVERIEANGGCNGNGCETGEQITWSVFLYPHQTETTRLVLRVDDDAPAGTVLGQHWRVEDADRAWASTVRPVSVETPSPLAFTVTATPDPVRPGTSLTYVATVANPTTETSSAMTLTLTLPAGTTLQDAGGAATVSTPRGVVATWSPPGLAPGAMLERRLRVSVSGTVPDATLLVGEARLAHATAPRLRQERLVTTLVQAAPRWSVAVEALPQPVAPGDLVAFHLFVGNPSEGGQSAGVDFPVPEAATVVSTDGGACPNGSCQVGEEVHWDLFLYPHEMESRWLVLRVRADAKPGDLLDGRFRITDDAEAHAAIAAPVRIHGARTWGLVMAASPDPVEPGNDLTFAITASNPTGASGAAAALRARVPAGTTVSDAGGGVVSGDVVSWSLPALSAGSVVERSFSVHVPGSVPDATLLAADVEIEPGDAPGRPLRATAHARVQAAPRLDVQATVPGGEITAGTDFVVSLRIRNVATGFVGADVWLEVPPGVTVVSAPDGSCPGGACDVGEAIRWGASLYPDEEVTRQAVVRMVSTAPTGTLVPVYWFVSDGTAASASVRRALRVRNTTGTTTTTTSTSTTIAGGSTTSTTTSGSSSSTTGATTTTTTTVGSSSSSSSTLPVDVVLEWPVVAPLTQRFDQFDELDGSQNSDDAFHCGLDIGAAAGTLVRPAATGDVVLIQDDAGSHRYGNTVIVRHRPDLFTHYSHLASVPEALKTACGAVPVDGARRCTTPPTVTRTSPEGVGWVGSSGAVTAAHLHFEVKRFGTLTAGADGPFGYRKASCTGAKLLDPLPLLLRGAESIAPLTIRPTVQALADPPLALRLAPVPSQSGRVRRVVEGEEFTAVGTHPATSDPPCDRWYRLAVAPKTAQGRDVPGGRFFQLDPAYRSGKGAVQDVWACAAPPNGCLARAGGECWLVAAAPTGAGTVATKPTTTGAKLVQVLCSLAATDAKRWWCEAVGYALLPTTVPQGTDGDAGTTAVEVTRNVRQKLRKNGRRTLRLVLNREGKRLLKERGALVVFVRATMTSPDGGVTTTEEQVTLTRRKRP